MTTLTPDQREDLIDAIAETMSDTCDLDVSFTQYARAVVGMLEKRGALQPDDASDDMEKLAAWMGANSFATGHSDTMDDLLAELEWQIKELRWRIPTMSVDAMIVSNITLIQSRAAEIDHIANRILELFGVELK